MKQSNAAAALPETRGALLWAARVWGSFFFTGYAPVASGTVGSLAAALVYWFLPFSGNGVILFLLACAVLLTGVPAATLLEKHHGDDPSLVVIDEVAGMWLALVFLPKTWVALLAAFLFFRLFDIIKPAPARQLDRMRGGAGIMLDDVIAGIYANIATQLLLLFL
ncbi:MAG: phosphatidylglycerophosphatase A [Bacteroidia bacterium]|nr:phosphatidylglycerophosphatase A [Bacteroidia bacterium]